MMQAGIFTGYFPYGLKETAERIRKLNFNTVQLDLTFKDMDLRRRDHQGQMPHHSRHVPRSSSADLLRFRLYQHRPSRQGRTQEAPRSSEGDHPPRARLWRRPM